MEYALSKSVDLCKSRDHDVSTSKERKNHKPTCHVPKPITGMSNPLLSLISFFILLYNYLSSTTYPIDIRQQPNGIR